MLAMGAQERVGFPDFLDEFAPLLGGDPAGLDQKRDDPLPEEFLQRDEAHGGHHVKKSAVHEEPVGNQRVEVRVEVEVFAEGVPTMSG